MGIRKYKPTSPARRGMSGATFEEVTTQSPERSLLEPLRRRGGRNNAGRVSTRHQGGGHKKRYRVIDFKRDKFNIPGRVDSIEYDPNRTSRISLVIYPDGEKRYIITPEGLKVGDTVLSSDTADIRPGNTLSLKVIPVGTEVHCVELKAGKGAQLARSAGTSVQLAGRDAGYAQIKLRSGEIRRVREECLATIGVVGNAEHFNIEIGKAGRDPLARRAAHRAGRGHESHRPPPRGGRGQNLGRAPSGIPLGHAHQGVPHAQQQAHG